MFSIVFENLLVMSWALAFSVAAVAFLTFPFMAWVEISRSLLHPVLSRMRPLNRATQYGVTDLGCLVAMMAALGSLTTHLVAIPMGRPPALLFLLLVALLGLLSWRCSISWLSRTGVADLVRRAVFQLIVVPTALFFPLLFVVLAVIALRLLSFSVHVETPTVAAGFASAALITALTMSAGRQLAVWVALGARR